MNYDKDLIEVYNILADKGLQTFFSAFYLQLQVTKKNDFQRICLDDLHRIGIVSRLCIKSFENIITDLDKDILAQVNVKNNHEHLPMFIVDSMLIKQDPVIINTNDILNKEALGSGHFGKVFKGIWKRKNYENEEVDVPVAVKTLTDGSEVSWKKEVAIFTTLNQNHPSIIKFFGLLISDQDEVKMVTEFAALGSLNHRLNAKYITCVATLSQFAVQIATGMVFLHSKNLVHRDLSARNILVTGKNQVKISDFGLSKVLGEAEDEWVMESNEMLPMRWLAPESFNNGIFTTSSDVWSFAVVLWEMFTFGDIPWGDYNNEQVKEKIQNGVALPEPNICPSGIYDVMLMCFEYLPESRPPFHVIRDALVSKQPETVVTLEDESGCYNLNFKKNEYVTAIKKRKNDADLWLGQHENTLLFGCFNRTLTESIEYTIPLHENDTHDNDTMLMNRMRHRHTVIPRVKPCDEDDKENVGDVESHYQVPRSATDYIEMSPDRRSSEGSTSIKFADCSLYENLPVTVTLPKVDIPEVHTESPAKIRPRSAVVLSNRPLVERAIDISNLKSDSDSKIMFKDTKPYVQETVNDRIKLNMKAFVFSSEPKDELVHNTREKDGYLTPVDVSSKPTLDSLINSVDPYPRLKAVSQENIYEEIDPLQRKCQSAETLIQDDAKRPRPKPRRTFATNQSRGSSMESYADSVKRDFDRFAETLNKPAHTSQPLPAQLNERKVSITELNDESVKNHEYLQKFSHVILPNDRANGTQTHNGSLPTGSNINKGFVHDKGGGVRQSSLEYSEYFNPNQDPKPVKHFIYDAKADLTELPASMKERSKRSVTNYTSNNWHMFDDCVKDTKRAEKSRKSERGKASEISWPQDMSKLSQNKKEEFSSKFKKIRAILPDATVSDCLEGLRYSQNDVKRAVRYIQVLKLTRFNFGFSFEHCDKVLEKCKGNFIKAEQVLKVQYVREQFDFIDREQVKELFKLSNWDLKETLTIVFLQNCREIGITESKAKSILEECNYVVLKALEMTKIVRLAEITNKPEHYCFRTLTHCHWKIDRAVDFIFSKET